MNTETHERDALAEAIGRAAIKCGLLRPDIEGLTGPQLLMIVDDMASALVAQASPDAVAIVGERGIVSWRSETILPAGAKLYAAAQSQGPDVPKTPTREHIRAFKLAGVKCVANYDDDMSPEFRGLEAVFSLIASEVRA